MQYRSTEGGFLLAIQVRVWRCVCVSTHTGARSSLEDCELATCILAHYWHNQEEEQSQVIIGSFSYQSALLIGRTWLYNAN